MTMFNETNVKVLKHLGAAVGSYPYKVHYVEDFASNWNVQRKLLSIIAESQPQVAHLAFLSGFINKLNNFMRTFSEISHHLVPSKETF